MTEWKLAMLCIAPFMQGRAQIITWAMLMGASFASYLAPNAVFYLALDMAGFLLFYRGGKWQQAIAVLFAGMAMLDVAALALPNSYLSMMHLFGWMQWLVLAAWGIADIGPPGEPIYEGS